jgi:uncharacterized protein (DUF58 family)
LTPTRRTAEAVAICAVAFLFLQPYVAIIPVLGVLAVAVVDALAIRGRPKVTVERASVYARGVPTPITISVHEVLRDRARIRQAVPPDITIAPSEGDGVLECLLTPKRRGRHVLPAPSVRLLGPLGLASWTHNHCGSSDEIVVFPDVIMARRLAESVRRGKFREQGRLVRGPLGLGTDFESIRDYLPDDDVRQVNWRATARLGRPMTNVYRVEQDRDVICVIDTGRLMAAPTGDRTRLDVAVDTAAAVAMVCDVSGDRCGVLAFDSEVRRELAPRRGGADAVVRAIFDLEPVSVESDYELAFHRIGSWKRALVFVFTDLLERSAARPLVEAMPTIARRHHVVVAGVTDPDIGRITARSPSAPIEVYESAVALDVLNARRLAVRQIRATGAEVIEAEPDALPAACVGSYLRAKARARV